MCFEISVSRRARALSLLFRCVLKFLATRLCVISFFWPRPPQRDDASKKIIGSKRVGSRLRKKTARAKAQTLHFDLKASIPRKTERAGIRSGLLCLLQGGSSESSTPMGDGKDVDSKPSPMAISTQGVLVVLGAG
jgi:hypothetical protein